MIELGLRLLVLLQLIILCVLVSIGIMLYLVLERFTNMRKDFNIEDAVDSFMNMGDIDDWGIVYIADITYCFSDIMFVFLKDWYSVDNNLSGLPVDYTLEFI